MIPILAAFAVGLSIGAWGGYDWGGEARYDEGVKDGRLMQTADHQREMRALAAEMAAEALKQQIEANRKANDQHVQDQQEIEYGRVQYTLATTQAAAARDRLAERVRDADAAARDAIDRARLSQATTAAARTEIDRLAAAGLVRERSRATLQRIVGRAETVSANLALCCATTEAC